MATTPKKLTAEADRQQQRHNVWGAYVIRDIALQKGEGNWETWQQHGVAAAEIGEACWKLRFLPGRRDAAMAFWRKAMLCFEAALTRSEGDLARIYAIECDRLRTQARMTRFDQRESLLDKTRSAMEALAKRIAKSADGTLKQRGIAMHFLGVMEAGRRLGLPGKATPATAADSLVTAIRLLETTGEPVLVRSTKFSFVALCRSRRWLRQWDKATAKRLLREIVASAHTNKDKAQEQYAVWLLTYHGIGANIAWALARGGLKPAPQLLDIRPAKPLAHP